MKTFKGSILFCLSLLLLAACEEQAENPFGDKTEDSSGYWEKHDGTGFIYLSESTAAFCITSSGNVYTGTYDPSTGDIDMDINGQQAHFEVAIEGNTMTLIQRFSGDHAVETLYYKSSAEDYPCGSGNDGGSGDSDSDEGDTDQSSGQSSITFWVASDIGCGYIEVNLEGEGSETITGFYDSYTPDCGSADNANFDNLDAGTYSYTASCGDYSWSGTVSIDANQCMRYQLTVDDDGSGGDGGDYGGGGSETGDLTFYLTEDVGCGYIYVSLAGHGSKTISGYFTSNPGCGASNSANFYDLEYGTYEFSATSDDGCTWSNSTVTVDRDCQTMRLYL